MATKTTWLFALCGVAGVAACQGSFTPSNVGGDDDTADAAIGGAADAAPPTADADPNAPPPPDAAVAADCRDPVVTMASGKHNAGQACLPCHDGNGGPPKFTLSGTLFAGVNSNTPVTGATILVTDANGQMLQLVTALNGNFWTEANVAFPVTVAATSCPDLLPMIAPVAAPGNCNSAGCHTSGFRVHVP